MECSNCGGPVEWKGPFSNLTHTECLNCGSVNSQVVDEVDGCECEDLGSECSVCEVEV
jgi:hypothetical protein